MNATAKKPAPSLAAKAEARKTAARTTPVKPIRSARSAPAPSSVSKAPSAAAKASGKASQAARAKPASATAQAAKPASTQTSAPQAAPSVAASFAQAASNVFGAEVNEAASLGAGGFAALASAFSAPLLAMFGPGLSQAASALSKGPLAQVMQGKIDPPKLMELVQKYSGEFALLWSTMLKQSANPQAESNVKLGDRRFASEAWTSNAFATYTAAVYLINARFLMELADNVQADALTKARIQFLVQQWVDASSPSNFLAFNPDAQKKAIETKGMSLVQGMGNMLADLQRGRIQQTDDSAFEVGRNVATTPGKVVFQNDFFQLIQYAPSTEKVYATPYLLVPPCINKFYILDLSHETSVVRYLVEQGHTIFLVSWRNPGKEQEQWRWDDYVNAVIEAARITREIGGQKQINILGYCVGGTLTATALSVMKQRGDHSIKSLTLLTCLLDFSDNGVLDIFIDEEVVKYRERMLGGGGLMPGKDMATTFNFLRPNDLVWNYVVGNYLKGETPAPFDLLYWNADSTNLPGPMYVWYLRNTYLENGLCKPNRVQCLDAKVDMSKLDMPVFLYGSMEDHIVPWKSAYLSTRVLTGSRDKTFVLGASGHIAGVINPPAKKKRNYWINNQLPGTADAWLQGAKEVPGSWWPAWAEWLKRQGGELIPARKRLGNAQYTPLEDAPGSYVRVRVS